MAWIGCLKIERSRPVAWLAYWPLVVALAWSVLWIAPGTRRTATILTMENGPFEMGTFAVALVGGLYGLFFVFSNRGLSEGKRWIVGGLSFLMVVFAMEEVAWGQHLFGFQPPEFIAAINGQHELTIHNLEFLQAKSEIPEFLISLVTVILLVRLGPDRPLSIPRSMAPLVALMVMLTAGDLAQDLAGRLGVGTLGLVGRYFNMVDELSEFLIAFAGAQYLWVVSQRLAQSRNPIPT